MMNTRNNIQTHMFYRNICFLMIWLIALYSSIIQFVVQIPYGMIFLGIAVLSAYIIANSNKPYSIRNELTIECIYMIVFMIYMLLSGALFAVNRNEHISQWVTCLEYLFILCIVSSIIKASGSDTFYYLLLVEAIILAFIFIRKPIDYGGRYSISSEVNPNGLGMSFATGIWALLYIYEKRKISMIFVTTIIGVFLYCVLLTGSRKALIAAGLIIFLWIFFCFIPKMHKQGGYRSLYTSCLMIVLFVVLVHIFLGQYTDSTIANRMNNLTYEASEGERSNMYRVGYDLFLYNPLFGIGFQGFKHEYGSYSHATLVEIPVSGGIIGALLYFIIYYISIKRVIYIYRTIKKEPEYTDEYMRIKMIMILWTVMLFYTTCIIHQYQFESYFLFGIIFGDTAYIKHKIELKCNMKERKEIGSKYIKYV